MEKRVITIKSYPQVLVDRIPLPTWSVWFIIWSGVFIIDYWLSSDVQTHSHFTELGIIAFFFSLCVNLAVSNQILNGLYYDLKLFIDLDETQLQNWYEQRLKFMYTGMWPILFSIAFVIILEISGGSLVNEINSVDNTLLIFRAAYRIAGFFLLGLCLWSILNFMRLPSEVLRFKLKPKLPNLQGVGIQAIGGAFFKVAIIGALSFALLAATIYVSPLSDNLMILGWLAFGGATIIGLFLSPLFSIHRVMVAEKRIQLVSLSSLIQSALVRINDEPSPQNLQQLKEMFQLQKHLQDLDDWPFNSKMLWQLISVLLIPLMLVLIEIFLK